MAQICDAFDSYSFSVEYAFPNLGSLSIIQYSQNISSILRKCKIKGFKIMLMKKIQKKWRFKIFF